MRLKLKLFHDIFDRSVQPLEELEYVAEEEDTANAWYKVGIALFQKLKFHVAVRAFDKAIERRPDWTEARFCRGVAQVIMGKFDPAIEDFTAVLHDQPNHFAALYNRGRLYARLKQHEEAIADLERSIEVDSRQARKLKVPRAIRIISRREEGRDPNVIDHVRDFLDQHL